MAGGGVVAPYSAPMGLVYVFNLIIGTGALALPRAVQDAGWLLGGVLLLVSAVTSYANATFVTEAMAAANGLLMTKRMRRVKQLALIVRLPFAHFRRQAQSSTDRRRPSSLLGADNPRFEPDDGGDAPAHAQQTQQVTPTVTGQLPRRPTDVAMCLQPKDEYFEIVERTELSQMARMFLNKYGVLAFCLILAVYLFGDLAIYGAVVPKSVMNMVCSGSPCVNSTGSIDDDETACRDNWGLSRMDVYRLFVLLFAVVVGPFVYVGMTKTKYLQILTTAARWIASRFHAPLYASPTVVSAAMTLMIVLASYSLATDGARGTPPPVDMRNFAKLFGITVYAFMCQHSLPAIVTPMMRKERLYVLLSIVYAMVLLVYGALALTGAFAFSNKRFNDVYTLNFINSCDAGQTHWYVLVMDYFLAMFPVFTISMNFPIVGVTLSNNLRSIALGMSDTETYDTANNTRAPTMTRAASLPNVLSDGDDDEEDARASLLVHSSVADERNGPATDGSVAGVSGTVYSSGYVGPAAAAATGPPLSRVDWLFSKVLIPTSVVALPLGIALYTDDVESLASYVGSYAGVGVQFVIPSMLVLAGRRACARHLMLAKVPRHASPFASPFWPYFMFVWAVICVAVVTLNNILQHT